jgi:hypothetical protein
MQLFSNAAVSVASEPKAGPAQLPTKDTPVLVLAFYPHTCDAGGKAKTCFESWSERFHEAKTRLVFSLAPEVYGS